MISLVMVDTHIGRATVEVKVEAGLVVGLDASNLLRGGGRTHLVEFVGAIDCGASALRCLIIWGRQETLDLLPDSVSVVKKQVPALEGGIIRRSIWQRYKLSKAAKAEGCDLLFVPGGTYRGSFHPVVTMSRNMLPFEWLELRRYGFSAKALKLVALRFFQLGTYRTVDGLIFLNEYARRQIERIQQLNCLQVIIPHGVSDRFFAAPKNVRAIEQCSSANPFRMIYVSIVDVYKHQWKVVEAVSLLRSLTGWPVVLDLIGPACPAARKLLSASMEFFDPKGEFVFWRGAVAYTQLEEFYQAADIAVFASSCENMPNILLEKMASGIAIACSNRGPMSEFLGNAGVYFDPEDAKDIAAVLERLIRPHDLRWQLAVRSSDIVKTYSWSRCSKATIEFFEKVFRSHHSR